MFSLETVMSGNVSLSEMSEILKLYRWPIFICYVRFTIDQKTLSLFQYNSKKKTSLAIERRQKKKRQIYDYKTWFSSFLYNFIFFLATTYKYVPLGIYPVTPVSAVCRLKSLVEGFK